jgi:hypothetical protein
MELRMKIKGLLLATMFAVSSNASAALNTYFGQEQSPGGLVPVGEVQLQLRQIFYLHQRVWA